MTGALRHGGDPSEAEGRFGAPMDGWLDLSTGINPVPYPVESIDTAVWQRLPTPGDDLALLTAARAYYGVPDRSASVAAPGTQAIIQWLPVLRQRGRVDIVGPTYGEHAYRWAAAGHEVREVARLSDADADVIVIVNPNNPDGRVVSPSAIMAAADTQTAKNGWLVVDEAFADIAPEISVAEACGRPSMIVLRSFGKFFGLAGVRLGFAFGAAIDLDPLADALGPWSVPGPALALGARALADVAWQTATRNRLRADAARLDAMLGAAGMTIVGGTDLYRLVETAQAGEWFVRLAQEGILVRPFDRYPDRLRFGLPGDEAAWGRLQAALA